MMIRKILTIGLAATGLFIVGSGVTAASSDGLVVSQDEGPIPAAGDTLDQAREAVKAWLIFQNQGDFKGYSQLYAQRMTGIKRSGTRTRMFDRTGWLADRKKMFAKPMTVLVQELVFTPLGNGVRARFTQHFTSGRYMDQGAKEMLLYPEEGQLRIFREEMLGSTLLPPPAGILASADRAFFVLGGKEKAFVILDTTDQSPNRVMGKAGGEPELIMTDDVVMVCRTPNADAWPEALQHRKGQKFRVYDQHRLLLETEISKFVLVGVQIPHFGMREAWKEMPRAAVAKEAWDSSAVFAAAEIRLPSTPHGMLWAQAARGSAPTVWSASDLTPEDCVRVASAIRETPAYQGIQQEFAKALGKGSAAAGWETYDGAVPKFLHAASGRHDHYVIALFNSGSVCTEFAGNLLTVFRWPSRTTLDMQGQLQEEIIDAGLGMAEQPGGTPLWWLTTWYGTRLIVGAEGGKLFIIKRLAIPNHDCPC